jgi:hypothetical protein
MCMDIHRDRSDQIQSPLVCITILGKCLTAIGMRSELKLRP